MKFKIIYSLLGVVLLNLYFSEKYIPILAPQINLPDIPFNYSTIDIPLHLSTNVLLGPLQNAATDNDNTPISNPTTDEGATLGRVLFYDKNLSANQSISCASCHQQENGFSDNRVLSVGFEGGTTRRHSMSLANAVWYDRGRFFWDERAATLEEQVLMPFQDPVEMGMTLEGIISAVESQSFYPSLFDHAFGSEEINADRISKALAQFIRSMVSVSSKYDEGRQQVSIPTANFPNFTASENNGKNLFFRPKSLGGLSCIGCHSTEAFINPDAGATNNGLDSASTFDLGVFEAIPNPAFLGTFKVPSLKNIELTAPYMHDGRFASLEQVVEHYNSGVQNHPNLNNSLKDEEGNPQRLNLTEQEKIDLVNFLKTLTDESFVNDVKFSDPFIRDQCQEMIICNDDIVGTITLSASNSISANGSLFTLSNVLFEAGDSIVLNPGFYVEEGSTFTVQIKDCGQL
jgi:cytochrome c peroxidase